MDGRTATATGMEARADRASCRSRPTPSTASSSAWSFSSPSISSGCASSRRTCHLYVATALSLSCSGPSSSRADRGEGIMVKALFWRKRQLSLRDIAVEETLGRRDVRIACETIGICGSDVHYYTHGRSARSMVRAADDPGPRGLRRRPRGRRRRDRAQGRRPGLHGAGHSRSHQPGHAASASTTSIPPCASGRRRRCTASCGRTWCIPPTSPSSCRTTCPSPQAAMVEPLAVGVHAATKAQIKPGDIAVVIGAGPIGLVTLLAAFAAGCARVIVSDVDERSSTWPKSWAPAP